MTAAVEVLALLPEVAAIGQRQLQQYCDAWLQRPIARNWGIVQLNVTSGLNLQVLLDERQIEKVGDRAVVPIDELIGYIIDQHCADAEHRRRLHSDLREAKQRINEFGHGYEATVGRIGTLHVKCRNPACGLLLETSQRAVDGQTVSLPLTRLTCPICGHTDLYDGSDLKLLFRQ